MLVDPGAVHVCYCHNPFRYAWSEREATLRARGPLLRPPLRLLLNRWRQWDYIAAQRVDAYVANSHLTASRVRRYLGREATVLHPPVELERFAPVPAERIGDHYLVLAELMAHKRIDVAVRAFNALGPPARGRRRRAGAAPAAPAGRAERSLHGPRQRRAGRGAARHRRARWSSRRPRSSGSRPSSRSPPGRPVIALGAGGVRESVREGVTGAYYERDDPEALARAVEAFDPLARRPGGVRGRGARSSARTASATSCARIVARAVEAERAPRPGERPAVVTGLLPRRTTKRAATG